MRKNKDSGSVVQNTSIKQKACLKIGDGGTYIGGGRLFKKKTQVKDIDLAKKQDEISLMDTDEKNNAKVLNINNSSIENNDKNIDLSENEVLSQSDFEETVDEQEKRVVAYGDYHTHSVFSDGANTLEENIQQAIKIGLKEYAITDHAFRHRTNGISLANFQVQKRMVELYREKYPQLKIYHSLESNIMGYSGLLDTDAYVNELDFLQMGFHKTASNESFATWWSFTLMNLIFRPSKAKIEKNTLAYLRCIDRYPLKFVNHLNYGVLVNCKEIAKLCVERGTKIELNGRRVLFSQKEVDEMLETGVEFVVNSDSHTSTNVGNVTLPLEFAKTHGIPLEKIVNLYKPLKI